MTSQLEQLKKFTKVVADTGEINNIKKYLPLDATTNPSLIFKAASLKEYEHLVKDAVKYANEKKDLSSEEKLEAVVDKLFVLFGIEILKVIPGRVSTEVDARLSFDTNATVKKARTIIDLYKSHNISKDRILIKIASTYEGCQAAKILESEGIHCNMTLLFSLEQAILAAECNATLISPFVGRILDFFKAENNVSSYKPHEDPGVLSVQTIYNYYKHFDYKTVVMGASFRNKEELLELAGIDLLTISPNLLQELSDSTDKFDKKLSVENAKKLKIEKVTLTESSFRWKLCENKMAYIKLAEGIRGFANDTIKLETMIKKLMK